MHAPARGLYSRAVAEYDPIDVKAQARAREQQERRERVARETEVGDMEWLMSSKRGRRIVWRLLERAGVFRLSFNTNAMSMAFAEGNRNAGLALLDQVHVACPDQYPVMLAENRQQKQEPGPNDD